MAKNKFQMSQIPLAQRMLLRKFETIREHRNDAALIAMKLACVALNETEGLGFKRLARFAKKHQELVAQYYEGDIDVSEAHLNRTMEQLGFKVVDGHIYGAEDQDGNIMKVAEAEKNGRVIH